MVAFLVVAGIVGLCVLLTVLVLALKLWLASERTEALAASAPHLGLSVIEGRRLGGQRGGVPVEISHSASGGSRAQIHWTNAEARIEPPLRLGLELRARSSNAPATLKDMVGEDLEIGDPALDGPFQISVVERADVPRLLAVPELRAVLLRAAGSFDRVWITDERAYASMRGFSYDPANLAVMLDWVVSLAVSARAARRRMGRTARDEAIFQKWGPLAGARGYALDAESLVLSGTASGVPFTVAPVVEDTGWATRFRARLPRPLGVDLRLSKQDAFDGVAAFLGMQDIEIGDPSFDDAFVVRGRDEAAVRWVLADPTLRAGLVELLGAAKRLEVADTHVEAVAHGLVEEPAALDRSLGEVIAIARGLGARALAR